MTKSALFHSVSYCFRSVLLLNLSCLMDMLFFTYKFNHDLTVIYFNIIFSDYFLASLSVSPIDGVIFTVYIEVLWRDILTTCIQVLLKKLVSYVSFLLVFYLWPSSSTSYHLLSSSGFRLSPVSLSLSLSLFACFPPLQVPYLSGAFGKGHTDSGIRTASLCQDSCVVSTLLEGPTASEMV